MTLTDTFEYIGYMNARYKIYEDECANAKRIEKQRLNDILDARSSAIKNTSESPATRKTNLNEFVLARTSVFDASYNLFCNVADASFNIFKSRVAHPQYIHPVIDNKTNALTIGNSVPQTRDITNKPSKRSVNDINAIFNIIKTDLGISTNYWCDGSSNTIVKREASTYTYYNPNNINLTTYSQITNGLTNLLVTANNHEPLFFYYSGYGGIAADLNIPKVESDNLQEFIYNENIKDETLTDIIENNVKDDTPLFLMFDCSHSGGIINLRYKYKNITNTTGDYSENQDVPFVDMPGKTVVVLSSCGESEYNTESKYIPYNQQHGQMTIAFIESLKTHKNDLKNLTWRILLSEIRSFISSSSNFQTTSLLKYPQLSSNVWLDLDTPIFIHNTTEFNLV